MITYTVLGALAFVAALLVLRTFKVVKEYERGVKFTLGQFEVVMQPGLRTVIPFIQSWERVDMRVKAVDLPRQESITRDNVTVEVDAVIYYQVRDAKKAILEVEEYSYAVEQLAQTTMRNIVGEVDLDALLAERERISQQIREIIDEATDPWGIEVQSVELKDIILAENMKRVIARQAEAERERRAVTIQAEGELEAAQNMADAASTLNDEEGALHLRTLQTLNSLSSDDSNTVIFAVPAEALRALERIGAPQEQSPTESSPDTPTPSSPNATSG
ncbi:MAG: slipin family protein [Salinibacter sp.]|uniref:slipin family protein n=1 Tax=Salinibacter sp. TaxID=2065818 RepID=UPI0035D4AD6F